MMALSLERPLQAAVSSAAPWVIALGRLGCAAKGVVYLLIGLLAGRVAWDGGGRAGGKTDALRQIIAGPFGTVLLALLMAGLFGYSLWRLVQAVRDTDGHGTEPKALLKRVSQAVSGLIYGSLALTAWSLLEGLRVPSEDAKTRSLTAQLMSQPGGRFLVGAVAGIFLVLAGVQVVRAVKQSFLRHLDTARMGATERGVVRVLGQLGLGARAVLFAIVGGYFAMAAFEAAPKRARGIGGALDLVLRQPFGPVLLAVVALGLAAYGIYMLFEARYRRIVVH